MAYAIMSSNRETVLAYMDLCVDEIWECPVRDVLASMCMEKVISIKEGLDSIIIWCVTNLATDGRSEIISCLQIALLKELKDRQFEGFDQDILTSLVENLDKEDAKSSLEGGLFFKKGLIRGLLVTLSRVSSFLRLKMDKKEFERAYGRTERARHADLLMRSSKIWKQKDIWMKARGGYDLSRSPTEVFVLMRSLDLDLVEDFEIEDEDWIYINWRDLYFFGE